MTLFERLRLWLSPNGRDIGDKRYGEALYAEALARAEAWDDDIDLSVDPIREAHIDRLVTDVGLDDEAMADEWANEGGAPAGQVPNCS